jgi:hypothetical protein
MDVTIPEPVGPAVSYEKSLQGKFTREQLERILLTAQNSIDTLVQQCASGDFSLLCYQSIIYATRTPEEYLCFMSGGSVLSLHAHPQKVLQSLFEYCKREFQNAIDKVHEPADLTLEISWTAWRDYVPVVVHAKDVTDTT